MSTYVIGDIHGCYDDLMRLFDMLELSSNDRVYFVGDYIDRGRQNLEMLRFIESRPGSFHMIQAIMTLYPKCHILRDLSVQAGNVFLESGHDKKER